MDLYLKENGITVVHVVSSTLFAKAQNAGDAIVAEGLKPVVITEGMKLLLLR
jgi:hypothetical protein